MTGRASSSNFAFWLLERFLRGLPFKSQGNDNFPMFSGKQMKHIISRFKGLGFRV